jgi:exonuclease VII small subunit
LSDIQGALEKADEMVEWSKGCRKSLKKAEAKMKRALDAMEQQKAGKLGEGVER